VDVFSYIFVFLLSTIKFLAGILLSVCLQPGFVFSYLTTVGGGVFGSMFFLLTDSLLIKVTNRLFPNRKRKIFSKKSRLLVKLRKNFGLMVIPFFNK